MQIPNAPLFRDPVYDGAADPVVIYNYEQESWWMLYTNRRAQPPYIENSWIHGTDIGIAESCDNGKTWLYRGIVEGLDFERGHNTYWAPEVIYHAGVYHMYVSYVRGIPTNWNWERAILHYTSENLWDWEFQSKLELSSNRVIDAAVFELPQGGWRMWYKDEVHGAHTWAADSHDLYHWTIVGEVISDCAHEGPNVFELDGRCWMLTDEWRGQGVYFSEDLSHWTKQQQRILEKGGSRPEDGIMGNHADVVVTEHGAYAFYFTHPDRQGASHGYRSSIQVARLKVEQGILVCDRDEEFDFILK